MTTEEKVEEPEPLPVQCLDGPLEPEMAAIQKRNDGLSPNFGNLLISMN
jgi:hypothetical protein